MSKSTKEPQEAGAGKDFYPKRLGETYERMVTLAIDQVCCDRAVRPREELNPAAVQEYCELMQAGEDDFPPVHVADADGKFLLMDGHHRLEAAKLAGREEIRCFLYKGDRRHAILLSASANVRNGLSRTREDKRRAVIKLLSDAEWRQWSDRLIARYCGVTQPFVSGLRAKMANVTDNVIGGSPADGKGATRRYFTKHGGPAVMHLPARQRSSAVVADQTDQPLTKADGTRMRDAAPMAVESMGGTRARFIEAVVACEEIIRATDVTTIRVDPAVDKALYYRLTALAQLIMSKADMLAHSKGL